MGNRTTFGFLFLSVFCFANLLHARGGTMADYCAANPSATQCKTNSSQPKATSSGGSTGSCQVGATGKTMTNGVTSVPITITACVPAGKDANSFCRSKGSSFFDLPGGGQFCNSQFPNGYKQICQEKFGYDAQHSTQSTGKGSYRTVSDQELSKCLAGNPEAPKTCDPKQGTWKSSGGKDAMNACYCSDNTMANVSSESECGNGKKTCSENEVASTTAASGCACKVGFEYNGQSVCVAKSTAAATAAGVSQAMIDCVARHEAVAGTCEKSAADAKQTCNQKDTSNPEVSSAMNVPAQVANQLIQAKSGSEQGGIINNCFEAGLVAQGSNMMMQKMSVKCNENFSTCNESCNDSKYQEFLKQCGDLLVAKSADELDGNTDPNYSYFKSHADTIKKSYDTATPICKVEASKNKNELDGVLGGLARALQAGATCMCKIASTATGTSSSSCNSIPTAAECAANPNLTGCAAYAPFDYCTMGSPNYSAEGCKCQMTPGVQGCAGYVAANSANSGFAGADIATPNAGAAGFAPTNSKGFGGSDAVNLGSANDSGISETAKGGAGGPGFLGGGAGGGGGGSSAPGAGGEASNVARDGDGESKGLMGAFNQAKSFVSSMMGGTKSPSSADKGALNNKMNANQFRPPNGLRGIAADGVLGGKSKNIYEMMKDQYGILEPSLPSLQGP